MNKLRKRILAITLAMTMLIGLIPISSITVLAVPTNGTASTGSMHHLLSGYNLFSGYSIESPNYNDGLEPVYDFKDSETIYNSYCYSNDNNTGDDSKTYSGKTLTEYSNTHNINFSISRNANVGIGKLFSIGYNSKFDLNSLNSVNTSYSFYFFEYERTVKKGRRSFYSDEMSNVSQFFKDSFIDDLNGLTDISPENLFGKYGTHLITSYTMGGRATSLTATAVYTNEESNDLTVDYEAAINASATYDGVSGGASTAVNSGITIKNKYNNENYKTTSVTSSYGGETGAAVHLSEGSTNNEISTAFNRWAESISVDGTHGILIDENLKLVPIWEFLPDGERKTELYNKYMEMSLEQDVSFFEKYVYSMPENNIPDYSEF